MMSDETEPKIVKLKTSRDYIEVQQCDLDFEEEIRAAYAINGPVCSIIAGFREQVARAAIAAMPDSTQLLQTMAGALDIAAGRLEWLAKNIDDPRSDVTFRWAEEAKAPLAQFRAQEQRP